MPETTERFETWALVEIMGHKQLAGLVRETTLAGAGMLRVDVPAIPGEPASRYVAGHEGLPAFTKLLSPSAIYAITPVEEDVARRMAASLRERPVEVWRLDACRALPPATVAEVEEEEAEGSCALYHEGKHFEGDICPHCGLHAAVTSLGLVAWASVNEESEEAEAEPVAPPPPPTSPPSVEIPFGALRPCPYDPAARGSKCEHFRADARCAETSALEPDRRCLWSMPVRNCPLGRTHGDVSNQAERCGDCPATTPEAPVMSEPCLCWMPF